MDPTFQITTHHKSIPSPVPSSPSIHFHLTKLTNTLMIWVGTAPPSQDAVSVPAPEEVRLSDEWAAAWSPGNGQPVGTPLYRATATDLALPMAQRLAKRHPKHQILLSLSLPSSLSSPTPSSTTHPYAGRILLMVEKRLSQFIADVA